MRRLGVVAGGVVLIIMGSLVGSSPAGAQIARVPWPAGDSVTAIRQETGYSSADAEVLRLYRAFFLREPDPGGARYWIGLRGDGLSLEEIASNFVVSIEFANTYGDLSDADFVARVYENVVGRTADASGLVYWTGELTSGRLTRGGVVYWITANEELIRGYPYAPLGDDLGPLDLAGAALPVGVCDSVTDSQRTLLGGTSVWVGAGGERFALHDVDSPLGPFFPEDFNLDGRTDIGFLVACFDSAGIATSSGMGIWLSGQDPIVVGLDLPEFVISGHRMLTFREFPDPTGPRQLHALVEVEDHTTDPALVGPDDFFVDVDEVGTLTYLGSFVS